MSNAKEKVSLNHPKQALLSRRAAMRASAGLLTALLAGCLSIEQNGSAGNLAEPLSGEGPSAEAGQSLSELPSAPKKDHPAPDFTLNRLDGGELTLSELRGVPVILNFWATWCGPCRLEMPHLQEASATHGEDLVILGVNLTQRENDTADIPTFVDEYGLTFPIVLDEEGTVAELYQVRGQPASVFINAEGIVHTVFYGPVTKDFIEERIMEINTT